MLRIQLFPIFIALVMLNSLPKSCGYRILVILPLNARSHMQMFEQLLKGLARRGHQVDVINTFPQKLPYPNYTDIIIPSSMPKLVNNMSYHQFQDIQENNMVHFLATVAGNHVCQQGFTYPEIQKLIKNPPQDPPYDLVMIEVFSAHCFIIFGHLMKVPVIGLSSAALYPWGNDYVANPENLAFVPNNLLEYMEDMNFWNRLYNVVHNTYTKLYFNYYTSTQSKLIEKYFGTDAPNIRQLEQSLALILTNSHFSLNGVKPTTPALVEVGGLHIHDDGPEIPIDHKTWLDESEDGFIYFTFGSMVTIESFPKCMLENVYKSFRKISPMRVFMKVPQPELLPPGLPENVRTFVWMPQLKVLNHRNIRAFITHGGLMSTQEAISCAVPMIGIPLFADQFLNIDLYVKKKIALRLDYHELTEAKLNEALEEVLNNPIYRKNVKKVSDKFMDRPLTPMDEASYWVEYVVRHGNKALRSPAHDLLWWQIALLDIYITLIIVVFFIVGIVIVVIRFIMNIAHVNASNVQHNKKTD